MLLDSVGGQKVEESGVRNYLVPAAQAAVRSARWGPASERAPPALTFTMTPPHQNNERESVAIGLFLAAM